MKRNRLILVGLVLTGAVGLLGWRVLLPAQAQVEPTNPKTVPNTLPQNGKTAAPESPDAGIKKITEEYVKAFNARDAKAVAALWTDEGEYTGVDGETIHGRAAIEKNLADEFKTRPKATIDVQVESVRPISRQTAVAEGVVRLKLPRDPEPSETRYSALHVLENGKWLVASVQEWLPSPGSSAATKQLEWFIGTWTAKGDAGTITITYNWDDNKTFLYGKYEITKDNVKLSSGTQVFGKTPTGGLRSWMFDSSGVTNTGMWEREGNRWIEEATGMLADSTPTSSVNVLIPLGPDAYLWQTTERTVGGYSLTPPRPIKVTRVRATK